MAGKTTFKSGDLKYVFFPPAPGDAPRPVEPESEIQLCSGGSALLMLRSLSGRQHLLLDSSYVGTLLGSDFRFPRGQPNLSLGFSEGPCRPLGRGCLESEF